MRELIMTVDPSVWTKISGIAFLVGFCVLLCWVYWPSRKPTYEALAHLPVEKD